LTAALRPPEAFAEAGIIHQRRPHPMIYDAFANAGRAPKANHRPRWMNYDFAIIG